MCELGIQAWLPGNSLEPERSLTAGLDGIFFPIGNNGKGANLPVAETLYPALYLENTNPPSEDLSLQYWHQDLRKIPPLEVPAMVSLPTRLPTP